MKKKKKVSEKEDKKIKELDKEKSFLKGNKKAKILDWIKPSKTMLIEMTHANGTISHYVVATQVHKFKLNGLAYIVDEERKVYNNSTKLYMLRYHEGFALPYQIEVSAPELKGMLPKDNEITEVKTSFNPFVLPDVLKFEYAKGVIQGAEVHEYIKRSFVILIIILCAVLAHMLLNTYKSGWF